MIMQGEGEGKEDALQERGLHTGFGTRNGATRQTQEAQTGEFDQTQAAIDEQHRCHHKEHAEVTRGQCRQANHHAEHATARIAHQERGGVAVVPKVSAHGTGKDAHQHGPLGGRIAVRNQEIIGNDTVANDHIEQHRQGDQRE